jgi:hypothetical protein
MFDNATMIDGYKLNREEADSNSGIFNEYPETISIAAASKNVGGDFFILK